MGKRLAMNTAPQLEKVDSPVDPDRVLQPQELADAVGITARTIWLMRKAGNILGDPIPHLASPSDLHAWRRRWPQFLPKDWEGMRWADRLEKYNAEDRRALLVSKYGAK